MYYNTFVKVIKCILQVYKKRENVQRILKFIILSLVPCNNLTIMLIDSVIYISSEIILGFLACVGNGLVLLLIIKNESLQTVTNCFIASLALADFIVGIAVTPISVLSHLGLPHNFLGCVFTNSFIVAFCKVSILSLLAIALERYFAISHPFLYTKHLDVKRALFVNAAVWCLGIVLGFIPMYGWNLKVLYNENWICSFVTVIDLRYSVYLTFFACILTPLIIITICYVRIFLIVRRHKIQIAALENVLPRNQESSASKSISLRDIKAAKSLAIVIFLFALMWMPINILNTISVLCVTCQHSTELLLVTILLSHANSAVNPFLYAYGNSNFKKAFKRLMSNSADIGNT